MEHFARNPLCENCSALDVLNEETADLEKAEIKMGRRLNFYRKGEAVFSEGNKPSGVFCLKRGKVKIQVSGVNSRNQIVRFVGVGELLGARAMIRNEYYTSSAIAIEDSAICYIPKNEFLNARKSSKLLDGFMLQSLVKNLHLAEEEVVSLSQNSIRIKLARTIIMLSRVYGLKEDGMTLQVELTREELANLVGAAIETTIRMLSSFKKEKMIDLSGRSVKILNLDSLESCSTGSD